ncbi:MAG: thiamine pyrophosphate-dependent enzyme [Nocardioidaceae bacterium]
MPHVIPLEPSTEWVELSSTDEDWDKVSTQVLKTMLVQLYLIRAFEEEVLSLASQGLVHGPAHSSIGQEGGAVGSCLPLTSADQVTGSHRGHHQFLAKAFGHVAPEGLDPKLDFSPELREILERSMAEICGLASGYCGGRGGSMHLQWTEAGAMGTNAIVGGAVPQAAGFAWSDLHAGTDAVSVTYFGDGAVNIGSVLETFNLAAAWKVPVCFFIENNHYAVSTTPEEATGEPRLSGRGIGFGIPSWRVDGMDPLAVQLAMEQALEVMRSGGGPTIIEADVYRYLHQNGPFPGSAFGYRTKEEEKSWRERDPLIRVAAQLVRRGGLGEQDVADLWSRCKQTMQEISGALLEPDPNGKPGANRYKPELLPDATDVDSGIRGDLSELDGARYMEPSDYQGEWATKKFVDVVADVMHRRMDTDERIVVMGEDVHKLKGGPRGATRGLAQAFPGRVLGTPIAENAFVGLAGGMALDGRFRPVAELMYADFIWVSADQLFNQVAKMRHMFGGDSAVPYVLRIKIGTGTGYGSQHSMDPAGILASAPGWRIIAPSTPYDYVGLMNTALQCDDPVAVLEHDKDLYAAMGEVPADDLDYCLPVGKAALRSEGSDVTVISYLSMVQRCLDAVEETGVSADVIDLRWLDRGSLDWDTIEASVKKTNNVLLVEQGAIGTSHGSWLADEIQRRLFDWLDAPVERVTGGEASPSVSKVLEQAALGQPAAIATALQSMVDDS